MFHNDTLPCWEQDGTLCNHPGQRALGDATKFTNAMMCRVCTYYKEKNKVRNKKIKVEVITLGGGKVKKRHKAMMVIGAGALVYGIGIKMGVSFLNGNNSHNTQQQNIATSKPSYIPTDNPESLSKWVAEIHPAAGTSEK